MMKQNFTINQVEDQGQYSLQELEEMVVDNIFLSINLITKLRQQRNPTKSQERECQTDIENNQRILQELITQKREKPTQKKVTIVDEKQIENEGSKGKTEPRAIEMEKGPAAIKALDDRVKKHAADVQGFINVNRRHQQEFNRHKSSNAMKTLLSADENLLKKQQAVTNGVQVISKIQFEDRKNKGEDDIVTLNNQKLPNKSIQPSQRKQSGVPAVKQPVVSEEREKSKGRASSRWRQGVTQDSLERLAQESARIARELMKKKMVYPSWWQGQEEIGKEQNEKQNKNQYQSHPVVQIDPVRAKVYKNLHRYAEDSLDARLRQITDGSYHLSQDQNQQNQSESVQVVEQSDQAHQAQHKKQKLFGQKNPSSGMKQGKKAQGQVSYHSSAASSQKIRQRGSNQKIPSVKQEIKMLEPLSGPGNLNHTHGTHGGSLSSFAYTSNKGPAKYSPVRHKTAGASNVPMSYSGPPTQEEMARNANRHVSGNRNFVQQTDMRGSQRQPMTQQSGQFNSFKGASMRKDEAATLYEKGQSIFLETQLEAQRNRMKNQNYMREDLSSDAYQEDSPQADGGGMKRYARGGIALTIATAPQDQRSRSGSKAKYPYPDREPFQQNISQDYRPQKFNSGPSQQPKLATTGKRLPKELSSVESTIKSRVEFDKRAYFERQRLEEAGAAYRREQLVNRQVPPDNINPQIFYLNKDQARVIYEEGQETYRPPRQYDPSQSSSTMQYPQIHSFQNSNPGQAGYLRKKASPAKYAAINEEFEENTQSRIAIQPMNNNYLQSLDSHNETGFTNKLMAQNNSYFVPPPKGHGQLYVPQANGYKDSQQMNRQHQGYQQHQIRNNMQDQDQYYQYNNPHMANRGQYSYNRQQNYAQQELSVGSANGEEEYEQTYEGEEQLSQLVQNQRETLLSNDKHNTSRFAFGNERDAAAARDIERNFRQYSQYNYGGAQGLQNQLEHVLRMKSTEFNTSGAQNNESAVTDENIDGQEGLQPENRGQYAPETQVYSQNQYKHLNQPHLNQQNYGNPNFVPPNQQPYQNYPSRTHQPHGPSQNLTGKSRGAKIASRDSDNQNQYKNQYPATLQQYEQSNQNNFNTSKFPGENSQKYGSRPQLGGQPQTINDSSNNFTLQRPSTDMNNVQKLRNNTNKEQANLYYPTQPNHAQTAHQNQQERRETQNHKDSMNKRDRDYRQVDIDQGSHPNNNYPMISSGRRHDKQKEEQYVMMQPPNKNYQTFNEDESSFILQRQLQSKENLHNPQQQQASYQYQDNDYLDERQGDNIQEDENEMDGEDDQMGSSSSQLSDSHQSSPDHNNYDREIVRGDMDEDYQQQEGEDDDLQETKTEHLRNFMEQAQPADGILDSQMKSQYSGLVKSYVGGEQASAYAELRKHINGAGDQQFVGSVCLQKTNSDITLNNEGGSKEEPNLKVKSATEMRSQNNYAGLKAPNNAENGNEFTEESSPQISLSHTDQLESQSSPSHDEGEGYGTQAGEMDAMDSSSFQDSPESQAIPQHYIDQDPTNHKNLQNIQNHAQNLASHLVKMNDGHLNQLQMVQGTSQDSASLENTDSLQQEHQNGYGQINYIEQQQTTKQPNEEDPSDSLSDLNDSQL